MHHREKDVFGLTLASLFLEYGIELWALHYKGKANHDGDVNELQYTPKKKKKQ